MRLRPKWKPPAASPYLDVRNHRAMRTSHLVRHGVRTECWGQKVKKTEEKHKEPCPPVKHDKTSPLV